MAISLPGAALGIATFTCLIDRFAIIVGLALVYTILRTDAVLLRVVAL